MPNVQHTTFDARFAQAGAKQHFQELLQLVRTNRDVSDWLYSDCPEKYRADRIVSPETFKHSVATSTLQSYTNLAVPTNPLSTSDYSETYMLTLYVPVKVCNGVALGYSFHTAIPRLGSSVLNSDLCPNLKTNRGWYAYKKDERLLVIRMRSSPKLDVMFSIEWTGELSRRVYYFVIPHREYGYDNQPSVFISAAGSDADSLCGFGTSPRRGLEMGINTDDVSDVTEELPNAGGFVDGIWQEDNINSLPQCMFQDLESSPNNQYKERSSWLKEQQVRSLRRETKGFVQFERRRRLIEEDDTPEGLLNGHFFSAHVIRDLFDGHGGLVNRHALEVRTRTMATEGECLQVLRRAAAQVYYSSVLWASTDQRLVAAQEHATAELLWGKMDEPAAAELLWGKMDEPAAAELLWGKMDEPEIERV